MTKETVVERISSLVSIIEQEKKEKTTESNNFNEGFNCGTGLALDLLKEWLGELV